MLSNNFTDDQKGLGSFINEHPSIVYTDIYNKLLHTTTSFINGGICYNEQDTDSPTLNELIGQKSYFLHIPGLNISGGQKFLYNNIYEVIKLFNCKNIKTVYPNYNLINYKQSREEYSKLYDL
jgi:hypothetical protein